MGPLHHVSEYAIQIIKKMQTEYISSWVPKQSVTDAFNAHCQEWVRHTVWVDDCRSWYKNNDTGRVNAVWPGSSLHYIEAIKTPRYEDFEIEYMGPAKKNLWAFLGMGYTRAMVEKEDPSPYLYLEGIDPKWRRAMGIDEGKVSDERRRALEREILNEGGDGNHEEPATPMLNGKDPKEEVELKADSGPLAAAKDH